MRYLPVLILFLLVCCESGPGRRSGEAISAEQKQRLEAPFDLGLEFLARSVELQVSRNYFPELVLPAGGGMFAQVKREPEKHRWSWRARPTKVMQLLPFGLRKLKGRAVKSLIVEAPPIVDFRLRLRARGDVRLRVPATGKTYEGQELLVDKGRVTLDGRLLSLPLAAPPAGKNR